MAALDSILSPEWQDRYYSFDPDWSAGAHMASMRNGSGDDYFIGFCDAGVFVKGFAHESEMSPFQHRPPRLWPGMYEGVPGSLVRFREEPAFSPEDATFCLWWDAARPGWTTGVRELHPGRADPDGFADLMGDLRDGPEQYRAWAAGYFDADVPLEVVHEAYALRPLSDEMLVRLNPSLDVDDARDELTVLGYGEPCPFAWA